MALLVADISCGVWAAETKASFELRRRKVDAAFEKMMKETAEGGEVGTFGVFVIAHRTVLKKKRVHGADAVHTQAFRNVRH